MVKINKNTLGKLMKVTSIPPLTLYVGTLMEKEAVEL